MGKRGMSLITLAVTLAILVLITSTVVISGLSSMESAKKTTFGIEIKNIQDVVDEYILKTGDAVPVVKTISFDTSALSPDIIAKQFTYKAAVEEITNNILRLDVVDLAKLGIKDIKYGKGETSLDYYTISTTTNRIYYPEGVKAKGEVYYTLTDDLNKIIDKNDIPGTEKKSVIFTADKTTNDWVNSPVIVTVKVPDNYVVLENAVVVTNSVNVPANPTIVDGYKQYIINNTSNLITNYDITVKYQDLAIDKTSIYKVTKVDGTAPAIATPTQKSNIDKSTNIATAYINGITATDDISGVKSIKYIKGTVNSSVNIKDFFNEYGILVVDNKIQIEQGATSYSICAEDNAGNINAINVSINADIQSLLW